jgi:L-alanine-DL-glutamate epimerase-like enolase superfamily enzyme
MLLEYRTHFLEFKTPFKIAHGMRTHTPVVFTKISLADVSGYGEASMPPYLGETHESATAFLEKVIRVLSRFSSINDIEQILEKIDEIEAGNNAAKASVDIALHDLLGKFKNAPLHKLWNINANKTSFTTYTIGISNENEIQQKIIDATDYKILKVKLGSEDDKKMINVIRALTDKPIIVDVNQGWKDKYFADEMIAWLSEKNTLLVEQPLPINMIDETAWLTERSNLPIIADESCKRLVDIEKTNGAFSGINIKLMKSTGLNEARKMIERANELKMKICIGCMSETSCGVSAASQLAPLADWADLDGPLLIKNDFFTGIKFVNGKIVLSHLPGIGTEPITNVFK